MKRTMISLLLAFSMMGFCLVLAVNELTTDTQPVTHYKPAYVESFTVGSSERLQIRKVYVLAPEDSPKGISTNSFQECGCTFCLTELSKKQMGRFDVYTAVFMETDAPS